MIDLSINTDLARQILTGFIRSEITRTGFTRAVINLSGGIDSALSCYLAAEALGPENVLAILVKVKVKREKRDKRMRVVDERRTTKAERLKTNADIAILTETRFLFL